MIQPCYGVNVDKSEFSVFGRLLAPLTLYHCRILSLNGSCFFEKTTEPDELQLVNLAVLCSFFEKKTIDEFLTNDFSDAINYLVSEMFEKKFDTQKEFDKASEYLKYYMQQPLRSSSGESASPCAPWWGQLKSFLTEKCGYSNEDAWNCVVAEAWCELAFYGSRHGDTTLLTEATAELSEKIKSGEIVPPTQEELRKRLYGIEDGNNND